jgi:Holliday junction resolvase RusA-like endonuclease
MPDHDGSEEGVETHGEGLRIEVPLRAVPKQSFRAGKYGGYQPTRVTRFKQAVAEWAWIAKQKSKWEITEDPISIRLEFRFAWPVKTKKSLKSEMRVRTTRPDLDNLEKAVIDGLHCLWPDDSYVAEKTSAKYNAPDDVIIIVVRKIDEDKRLAPICE